MDLRRILTDCRAIVVQHHQQSRADLIRSIDAALASPFPVLDTAQIEKMALDLEIPIGTVARVLIAARAKAGDPSSAYVVVAEASERADG